MCCCNSKSDSPTERNKSDSAQAGSQVSASKHNKSTNQISVRIGGAHIPTWWPYHMKSRCERTHHHKLQRAVLPSSGSQGPPMGPLILNQPGACRPKDLTKHTHKGPQGPLGRMRCPTLPCCSDLRFHWSLHREDLPLHTFFLLKGLFIIGQEQQKAGLPTFLALQLQVIATASCLSLPGRNIFRCLFFPELHTKKTHGKRM